MLLFLTMFLFGYSVAMSSHDLKCFVHPPSELAEIPRPQDIKWIDPANKIRYIRLVNEGVNVMCSEKIEEIQLSQLFNSTLPILPSSIKQYRCSGCQNGNQYDSGTTRQYFFVPWKASLKYYFSNNKCMESMESLNDRDFAGRCYHMYSIEVLSGCKIIK
nr:PREDICTED: uncharacterized protein LOC103313234 [Tribolium castaneum]|eukprot:XP_008194213.1 PREDICTED: uncharacterized protein LOC103313234 [Tribolium castaneum]